VDDRTRAELARWWAGFLLLWCFGGLVTLQVEHVACHAENVELDDGSAKESYCDAISGFFESGEPSEWTTPLPWVSPVAVLAAVGGFGIWRRSKGFLSRATIVAGGVLILHVILLIVLPG
jgi:hypothetical protein